MKSHNYMSIYSDEVVMKFVDWLVPASKKGKGC